MTSFQRGQDVHVEFAGQTHQGEIITHNPPWVLAKIILDPEWDYGSMGPRLDPTPTVCIRETHVQHTKPTS